MAESKSSASQVQVGQKSYEMPPKDGMTIAHFMVVADIERSLRFYETVFGSRILSRGDSKGAPGYLQLANMCSLSTSGAVRRPTNQR
jgi:predicted enzyme related to lactoylglutathione lyase